MTHASLFSGIGGAEIAAAWLGWENLFHCDVNEFGLKVLRYWFPSSAEYNDIRRTDFRIWRGRVDVLTAGFPCQPFSVAGKRRGADDDRFLWPETIRAIREIRPAWFVGENVFGLASMVLPGESSDVEGDPGLFGEGDAYTEVRQRYVLDRICGDIEEAGYAVQPIVIPACAVGAPHRRDRIWFVARRKGGGSPQDPYGHGRAGFPAEGRAAERRQRVPGSGVCGRLCGDSPHPDGERLQGRGKDGAEREGGEAGPDEPVGHLRVRDASHACGTGLEETRSELRPEGASGGIPWADAHAGSGRPEEEGAGRAEEDGQGGLREALPRDVPRFYGWDSFPSEPPLCAGNDGLPFGVADLSVPFGWWRKEALKALGNAWVPEVAYEIFRMIQKVEEEYGEQEMCSD